MDLAGHFLIRYIWNNIIDVIKEELSTIPLTIKNEIWRNCIMYIIRTLTLIVFDPIDQSFI